MINMMDERFELMALVFRLAGRQEYNEKHTDYQKLLNETFAAFKEHPAVAYADKLPLGYDAVPSYAVRLKKEGTSFSLFTTDNLDKRWSLESAAEFLPLLNDFYVESGFADFFEAHKDKQMLDLDIDLDWFRSYGVDPAHTRLIYSPSAGNYGANDGTNIYSIVTGDGGAIVHELCHSFANDIAWRWYEEDPAFRAMSDASVNSEKLPFYNNGVTMAAEYVTRAYTILYHAQHLPNDADPLALFFLFQPDKTGGFPYIEDVYAMITPHETVKGLKGEALAEFLLGQPFTLGPEQSNNNVKWHVLELSQPLAHEFPHQGQVGNVFNTQTGQVMIANGGELYVDLGETTYHGSNVRKYCIVSLYDYSDPLKITAAEYRKHFRDKYTMDEMRVIIDEALVLYFEQVARRE